MGGSQDNKKIKFKIKTLKSIQPSVCCWTSRSVQPCVVTHFCASNGGLALMPFPTAGP